MALGTFPGVNLRFEHVCDVAFSRLAEYHGYTYLRLFSPDQWFRLIVQLGSFPTVSQIAAAGSLAHHSQLCTLVITEVADMVCAVELSAAIRPWYSVVQDIKELSTLPTMKIGAAPEPTRLAAVSGEVGLNADIRFDDGLEDGFCYLRLFDCAVWDSVRSALGSNPTWRQLLEQAGWRDPAELDMLSCQYSGDGWHVKYSGYKGGYVQIAAAICSNDLASVGFGGLSEYHWYERYVELKGGSHSIPMARPRYVVVAPLDQHTSMALIQDGEALLPIARRVGDEFQFNLDGRARDQYVIVPPGVAIESLSACCVDTVVRLPRDYEISLFSRSTRLTITVFTSSTTSEHGSSLQSRFFRAYTGGFADRQVELPVDLVQRDGGITEPVSVYECENDDGVIETVFDVTTSQSGLDHFLVPGAMFGYVAVAFLASTDQQAGLRCGEYIVLPQGLDFEADVERLRCVGIRVSSNSVVTIQARPASVHRLKFFYLFDSYSFDGGGLSPDSSHFPGYIDDDW